ncbi:hypothetical protein SUGI_0880170 [Cryptomeria japonica]|uniref:F-box/kelch-repeat protein At1g80440-like n=1 Tax=Cryptomeria japonica TaxID=3369 RepID=UPI0024147987|nr:F-box/kelch-repeat protein At1g80440-like [Cryptomeria japonica]GLJ42470.1 hypothetical protein SUGI_0880170 [Cryptomeria japonica]
MGSLFPCLPDEIGWQCLAREQLSSHHTLRCVCKSWNAALKNSHFYEERKRLKSSEQRICVVQYIEEIGYRVAVYDPEKNSCKSLAPIPAEIDGFPDCYFMKQKLVLITDMFDDSTGICVWLYDFPCSKWRQGAKTPLDFGGEFASAVDEDGGLIYIGGGFGRASVYNVEEDKWDVLPDMNTHMQCFTGAFADGKFYVMGISFRSFEVFDSYTRSWTTMENRFNNWHCFETTFGHLHYLYVRGLIEHDYSQAKVNIVGTFPMEYWGRIIDFAGLVSNKIFVGFYYPFEAEGFYMLSPPSETGGTCKLIGIERPSGLQGFVISAATLDL